MRWRSIMTYSPSGNMYPTYPPLLEACRKGQRSKPGASH